MIQDESQRIEIVLRRIIPVHDELYAVRVDQIIKFLLHKADDDVNVIDPRFVELPDLPLNERLALHLQKSLGRLQVDGHHAHSESRRKNDRTAGSAFLTQLSGFRCQLHIFVQISLGHQISQRAIDDAERMPRHFREHALVSERIVQQYFHDIAFLNVHEHLQNNTL